MTEPLDLPRVAVVSERGMRVGSAAMAAAALLTACSDSGGAPQVASPQPSVIPAPSSTTPIPSDTPTPAPSPTRAPTADAPVPVEQVATAWFEAVDRAYETLDSEELKALAKPGCGGCRRQIETIEGTAADEQELRGAGVRVRSAQTVRASPNKASTTVLLRYSALQVVDSDGTVLESFPSEDARQQLELERVRGKWLVASILTVDA